MVVDLHTHSVFSDGSVWPDLRVEEAVRDGLDAVAITEHLEYQPHADDIPHPDRNRAYLIAVEEAAKAGADLLVIHGSEITRRMPVGHANAIFLEDSNPLLRDDPLEVFREAARQGGFNFLNHPHWVGQRDDGVARLEPIHEQLIEEGLLHGIEVTNDLTFSSEALAIALQHDLTILGTSDIHGLVDWQYEIPQGGHRPVTLVFAAERSEAGIEQALRAGRTVAWMNDLLVGREEHLAPLLAASLVVESAHYRRGAVLDVTVRNRGSARITARTADSDLLYSGGPLVVFEPLAETTLQLKTGARSPRFELELEVLSALVEPEKHPRLVLSGETTAEAEGD
ncbi:MAG: PHP domain-containing protein [Acidobacteria bacterium]|nr:MAG: PHP domain-containing protein [Acidobacteriota bacterium]REK11355.1 MAG: PHP domain-containing protein [Acidobacteriota bacterium]